MVGIDFRVTNKYLRVGEFTNMESLSNEDWLYLCVLFVYLGTQERNSQVQKDLPVVI